MEEIIEQLSKIERGFQHIETEAKKIFRSKTIKETIIMANDLFKNDICQDRMLAVFY